ncbi:MAG: hypothetical protein OXJ64_21320 [Boseongicola sp.]|nr:hypothetical protein [Boseongicola sp.]
MLTTILWGGRIDDVSRRRLTDALSLAAHGGCFVRLPAFAAAARDLFRHASTAWAARHRHRVRPRCVAHPSRHPHAPDRIPAASPLHGDPLAAARHLCNLTRLRPHVTIVHGPEADHSVQTALSALQELSDSIADYLQQALQPLAPSIGRHAVHAFILETRREPRDLAACHSPGNAYVETLTLSEPRPNAVSLEVQGSIGGAVG